MIAFAFNQEIHVSLFFKRDCLENQASTTAELEELILINFLNRECQTNLNSRTLNSDHLI